MTKQVIQDDVYYIEVCAIPDAFIVFTQLNITLRIRKCLLYLVDIFFLFGKISFNIC